MSEEGRVLSVVPTHRRPAAEVSTPYIVRLGLVLTIEGRSSSLELAFCADNGDSACFLVKVGARSAVCRHCRSRHKVLGLIEALDSREIALGGDDGPWPIIMPELLLAPMFRGIQQPSGALLGEVRGSR